MGSCTSSKYTKDEDIEKNKPKKSKSKLNVTPTKSTDNTHLPGQINTTQINDDTPGADTSGGHKNFDEGIEFIDKDEPQQTTQQDEQDKGKKEVTSYQTTVVKNVEKEGSELLDHLKQESFIVFQNLFKEKTNQTINENIKTNINGENESSFSSMLSSNDELLTQIKSQALNILGNDKSKLIDDIIESSINLIKTNQVNNMNELEEQLKSKHTDNDELITKFINLVTGFLTAKGTDAGVMLSNILANSGTGLQGLLKETEKTTVKVTRTIKETMLNAKGEIIEVKKTVKIDDNPPSDILNEIEKKQQTTLNETHEEEKEQENKIDDETRKQAQLVVNHVVNAAIEKLAQEENPTKIQDKTQIETEFFINGKTVAEENAKSRDNIQSS